MAAEDRLITYRWGEEDHEEGAGEAWASEDFPAQVEGLVELLRWRTATLGSGGMGRRSAGSGLLRSVTVDHGLMGVGRGFIWQEGNHRLQVKVEVVKGKVN